jgi:phenylpyruvate tautomerase PptA (4-oxalocrotonate tautomerase family)
MPLVRIAFIDHHPADFGKRVGEVVFRTMVETINVPEKDNFQIVTPLERGNLVYDPSYLDIPRTAGFVLIQITLNEGRTTELKKTFYKALAERLNRELGVRVEDVFINLVEVKKENWSFGYGIAQYAE